MSALYERFLMSATRTPVKVPVMKATVQMRVQSIVPSHWSQLRQFVTAAQPREEAKPPM